ncbi:MAG: hypothetical protein IK138_08390 [Lachnospiraceae bacterium]|nr:hypothetical protein [Lachnospiraceae bacterium]
MVNRDLRVVEIGFSREMQDIFIKSKNELNYTASRFYQMLNEFGAVETAKKLIHSNELSEGFAILWEKDRLDLSVESIVIKEEFSSLFTEEEIDICRKRLAQCEYCKKSSVKL